MKSSTRASLTVLGILVVLVVGIPLAIGLWLWG